MLLVGAIISLAALPLFIVHLERHSASEIASVKLKYDSSTARPTTPKEVASSPYEKLLLHSETTLSTTALSSPSSTLAAGAASSNTKSISMIEPLDARPSMPKDATQTHFVNQSDHAGDEVPAGKRSVHQEPAHDNGSRHVHVIFSTDCSTFQHWQAIVLYYSARAAGQQGPLTRIASGCTATEQDALKSMHAEMSSQFRVHFTPVSHIVRMHT
jgi:hypothetical protein